MSLSTGRYSHRQFVAWGLGAALGAGAVSLLQILLLQATPDLSPSLSSAIVGTAGVLAAFLGGGLGYLFSVWFDEPPSMRNIRHSFLYSLVATLVIASAFVLFATSAFVSLRLPHLISAFAVAMFIAGFIASASKGVLNNLFAEFSGKYPEDPYESEKKYKKW